MEIAEIKEVFANEFGDLEKKFAFFDVSLDEARASKDEHIWKPGVYVFLCAGKVIKLGRALNTRQRAPNHIFDDTDGIMRKMEYDPSLRLLLLTFGTNVIATGRRLSKYFLRRN